jgi:two-component sensor histidine kinase
MTTFKDRPQGEVSVSLQGFEDGRIRLAAPDNGIGPPTGFDWTQTRSLGLHLVQMLARRPRATVEVSNEDGTMFSMTSAGNNK